MDVKLLQQQSIGELAIDLDQYVGLWAIDETSGMQLWDHARRMGIRQHVSDTVAADRNIAGPTTTSESADELTIAIVEINGTMTKRGSSLSNAGGTVLVRQAIRRFARDTAVDGIMLRIDSPGGTVAGTADLAAEVAAAAKNKPVYAYAEDTVASAAYWVASQADKVFANNRTAKIGSIGTLLYLYDFSAMAEKDGVRPVVIKTGEFKGTGVPGAPVTEQQEAYLQEIVDQTQAEFTAGVMAGRNMTTEQVAAVATGRVYNAGEAQKLGLIDGIQSFDETLTALTAEIRGRRRNTQRGSRMSDEQTATIEMKVGGPATFKDLKAEFPTASAEFLTTQLEADATLDQARAAYTRQLEERAAAAEAKAKEAEEKATAKAPPPGVDGIDDTSTTTVDAGDFNELVAERMREKSIPRHVAAKQIAKEHPEAREQFVAEHNAAHPMKRR